MCFMRIRITIDAVSCVPNSRKVSGSADRQSVVVITATDAEASRAARAQATTRPPRRAIPSAALAGKG